MRHIEIINSLRRERVGMTHADELDELEQMLSEIPKPNPPTKRPTASQIEKLSRGFDLLLQVVSGKPVSRTQLTNAITRAKEAQKILKS